MFHQWKVNPKKISFKIIFQPLSPPLLQPPVLDLSCHQELGVQIVGNPVSPWKTWSRVWKRSDGNPTCNIPDVPGSVRIVFAWQREEGTGDQVPPWEWWKIRTFVEQMKSSQEGPWVAELCLEAVQVVRPFRSEVCKGSLICGTVEWEGFRKCSPLTMMGVMPGRAGTNKKKEASKESGHHRLQHK